MDIYLSITLNLWGKLLKLSGKLSSFLIKYLIALHISFFVLREQCIIGIFLLFFNSQFKVKGDTSGSLARIHLEYKSMPTKIEDTRIDHIGILGIELDRACNGGSCGGMY